MHLNERTLHDIAKNMEAYLMRHIGKRYRSIVSSTHLNPIVIEESVFFSIEPLKERYYLLIDRGLLSYLVEGTFGGGITSFDSNNNFREETKVDQKVAENFTGALAFGPPFMIGFCAKYSDPILLGKNSFDSGQGWRIEINESDVALGLYVLKVESLRGECWYGKKNSS
ncbi:hypothetical protein OAB57_01655 [Bacteriovoracaceae bacterium]|nr:hypothetical protein [Bacteriovoracaceae bacterium]